MKYKPIVTTSSTIEWYNAGEDSFRRTIKFASLLKSCSMDPIFFLFFFFRYFRFQWDSFFWDYLTERRKG